MTNDNINEEKSKALRQSLKENFDDLEIPLMFLEVCDFLNTKIANDYSGCFFT